MILKPIPMCGDPSTGFEPSSLVAVQDFTTDDTTEKGHVFFHNEGAGVTVGLWEVAPSKENFDAYPGNEMIKILSGELILTSPDGTSQTYGAGDVFFMPKGTPCVWEVAKTLRNSTCWFARKPGAPTQQPFDQRNCEFG